MLLELIISLLAIFLLLVTTELLWRTNRLHVETSRKVVHIGTGIIVAFWPYFLDWWVIQGVSVLFLLVIVVSYHLHIFKAIHSIDRLTIGELLYPVGIGVCAFIEPAPWLFTVAILHLTLADGIAAIIGVKYGKGTRYAILGHQKSIAGSGAFFLTSLTILCAASLSSSTLPADYGWFIAIALALTFVENVSWYGLDDITVPVSVIVLLSLMAG